MLVEVVLQVIGHANTPMAVVDAKEVAGDGVFSCLELVVQHDSKPIFIVGSDDAVVCTCSITVQFT